ncbi:MAG: SiaB family protein kinase [Bacteroidales bacterium]|nr:SiaB family protein kinase [Bacteroidales bacterium]
MTLMEENGQVDRSKIEFLEDFYELLSKEVIIAYQGTFEKSVLSILAKNIETSMETSSKLRRKFFKMFLEFSQNIAHYSAEQIDTADNEKSGAGLLIIKHNNGNIMFSTGNMVETAMTEYINEKVTYINSLDREGLRNYKREQYKLVESGERSNLGLLQIALISGNDLVVNLKPIDDTYSFITISAEVPNDV